MKIWLPTLRTGTGTDVFAMRLAEGLAVAGAEPVLTWHSRWLELAPELLKLVPTPPGVALVHANASYAHALLGRGLPVVATVHHLVHDPVYRPHASPAQRLYHRWHLRWREAAAVRGADAVTAVSGHVAGTVRDLFGRADVEVVPNWVDGSRYRPDPDYRFDPARRARLLWVGNHSRRKGFDLLPACAALLGPGFELRCTGGLRGGTGASSAAGITWLGRLSEDQLVAEYRACDAVLSLSRYEGFGYSAIEAMACGKPFFGFAAGGLVDVVDSGLQGELLPVDAVDTLADAIRRAFAEPARLQAMARAARARVERDFQPSAAVAAYLGIYRRLLA